MKAHYTLLGIAAILTGSLTADTIKLKSGKEYQGSIISEDDQSYLFKIIVSSSITDERRITKDKISEIIPDAKDASDFKTVQSLVPTPDMLTEKSYKQRIAKTSEFLKKYPKSKHSKKVTAILETLKSEHQVIAAGGIKLDGQLISSSDIEANAYDIDARIVISKAKIFAHNNQYHLALRQWEEIEKNYPHSLSYKENIHSVPGLLKSYQTELQRHLDTLDDRLQKREAVLASLEENDRERTMEILAEKKTLYESILAKEKGKLKTKWLTIDPFNKQAIDSNLSNVKSALQSLKNTKTAEIKLAGPDLRGAWSALAKGDLEEASKHIQALDSLRILPKYIDPLKQQLTDKQTSVAAEKKATEEAAAAAKAAEEKAAKEAAEKASKKKGRRRKK